MDRREEGRLGNSAATAQAAVLVVAVLVACLAKGASTVLPIQSARPKYVARLQMLRSGAQPISTGVNTIVPCGGAAKDHHPRLGDQRDELPEVEAALLAPASRRFAATFQSLSSAIESSRCCSTSLLSRARGHVS